MKIKRTMLSPGNYRISIIEEHQNNVVYSVLARDTKLRLGPNVKGWEYGPEDGPKKLAFSLRGVEQAVISDFVLSRVQAETA